MEDFAKFYKDVYEETKRAAAQAARWKLDRTLQSASIHASEWLLKAKYEPEDVERYVQECVSNALNKLMASMLNPCAQD